jgi:hypothetical protein
VYCPSGERLVVKAVFCDIQASCGGASEAAARGDASVDTAAHALARLEGEAHAAPGGLGEHVVSARWVATGLACVEARHGCAGEERRRPALLLVLRHGGRSLRSALLGEAGMHHMEEDEDALCFR